MRDYTEAERAWQAWLAVDHLFSKRHLLAMRPTTTRAVFVDGYFAAAGSRDQRIRDLERAAMDVADWLDACLAGNGCHPSITAAIADALRRASTVQSPVHSEP